MRYLANLPWTIIGLILAATCFPEEFRYWKNDTLVFTVHFIWFIPKKYIGWTCGHVILINKNAKKNERLLRHELVHVEQHDRYWGLFPILYLWERMLRGYTNNRFEVEARSRANSPY